MAGVTRTVAAPGSAQCTYLLTHWIVTAALLPVILIPALQDKQMGHRGVE